MLSDNLAKIEQIFKDNGDMAYNHWQFGPDMSIKACSVYYTSLIQEQEANYMKASMQDLVMHEVGPGTDIDLAAFIRFFDNHGVSNRIAKPVDSIDGAVQRIVEGCVVIFIDRWDKALSYEANGVESRQVSEPSSEAVVQGPREGTIEKLQQNIGLIRRRLKTPNFKLFMLDCGGETRTKMVYGYVEGRVSEDCLRMFRAKIERISEMEVLETSYIGELVEDDSYSPFPQVRYTERPDVAVAGLLEGKILAMADGTGTMMLCPGLFVEFFHSSEDYYQRTIISSLIRVLRIFAFLIALTLPSIYIALTTYHPELIPTVLLLAIIDAREGIPFPAFVEAVIMEFFFELLREAGVRLPRPVGSAVSIVGALVIGEAAITAGIASPVMVIIVALTGIASFAIPQYSIAIGLRIMRFPLMLMSAILGGYGLMLGLIGTLLHLSKLRALGQPYLSPLEPIRLAEWRDVFVRAPLKQLMRSPRHGRLRR